jgi:hypothetical protein
MPELTKKALPEELPHLRPPSNFTTDRERDPYYILDALVNALPDLGKGIARVHYYQLLSQYEDPQYRDALNAVSELSKDANCLFSHDPVWHEFGIISHTNAVIDAAREKRALIDNKQGDLNWAVKELQSKQLDGLTLYDLLVISLALHDIGKFQPAVVFSESRDRYEAKHTDHEARGGDIIRAARCDRPSPELEALAGIFHSFAITTNHLDYIEQCVRMHEELGKLRSELWKAKGYIPGCSQAADFGDRCEQIAAQRQEGYLFSDFSLEKGVLFLFDSAGKVNFQRLQSFLKDAESDPLGADARLEKDLLWYGANKDLVKAYKQYPINREVGLGYLGALRARSGT